MLWYAVGALFGVFGLLVALAFDRGLGERTKKAGIGMIIWAILIASLIFFDEFGSFDEFGNMLRQQRNFHALCANPDVTCIETDGGWEFQGSSRLIDQICKTENTGITCDT